MSAPESHVLVVEDEAAILRGILKSLNREQGLRATGCSSVDEAVKVLGSDPPDLLVTDLNLPGRSGLEMMAEVHRAGLRIPIIAITAYRAMFEDGFPDDHEIKVLEKPFAMSSLVELIKSRLERGSPEPMGSSFQVTDYLQLAAMGRYSLVLRIAGMGSEEGWLEIVEGDIWNAFFGALAGRDAVAALMQVKSRAVSTQALTTTPKHRQIEESTAGLLLDLARVQDEGGRDEPDQRPNLDSGHAFAEALEEGLGAVRKGDWDAARSAFVRALEIRPDDPRARHNLERIERMAPARGEPS